MLGEGDRLDTVEGDDDGGDYGEENKSNNDQDRIEVNLDEVEDDDDNESLLGLSGRDKTTGTNLFAIKESKDGGLADMETGSEVYMSELLVKKLLLIHFSIYRLDLIWKILTRLRK